MKKFIDGDDIWADIAVNANLDYHRIFALDQIRNEKTLADTLAKCDIENILNKASYIQNSRSIRKVERITKEEESKNVLTSHDDESPNSTEIKYEDYFKNIVLTEKNW